MSLQTVLARVAELAPPPAPAAPAAPPATGDFAGALAQAQGALVAPTSSDAGAASSYEGAIDAAAQRNGLDPALLASVIAQESGFDPNATSPAGAQGLMQLMPQTAAALGVTNPYDPVQSIDAGARYLRSGLDRFGGNLPLALAAYNAGPGAVEQYGGVPPYAETQSYVQQVLGRYERLQSERSRA